MSYSKETRPMKLWRLIVLDLLIFAVSILTFAYFHHVRPREGNSGTVITPIGTPSQTASANQPTESGESDVSGKTGYSYLNLGAKFYDKFNLDGSVTVTDDSYVSGRVAIYISEVEYLGAVCHIADIYLCDVTDFRTVLAKDKFGKNYNESTPSMAARVNAILAVNGDYYGTHAKSYIVRNGKLYDDSKADDDICVLYSEGTTVTYAEKEFDCNYATSHGAWQAWSFGPKLLTDGKAMTKFNSKVNPPNPRTAIGYYEPGHYCIVAVDGRSDESGGLTTRELSLFFESLGCADAYNLDGGNTTVMWYNGETINVPSNGTGRNCSDAIYIADLANGKGVQ